MQDLPYYQPTTKPHHCCYSFSSCSETWKLHLPDQKKTLYAKFSVYYFCFDCLSLPLKRDSSFLTPFLPLQETKTFFVIKARNCLNKNLRLGHLITWQSFQAHRENVILPACILFHLQRSYCRMLSRSIDLDWLW